MMPLSDLPQALAKAAAISAAALAVTTEPDTAVVWNHERKAWSFFRADAWRRPKETSCLPWSQPPYSAVAIVRPDGTWTPGPGLMS